MMTKTAYNRAKKILSKDIFSFIDSGSHDELALKRNRDSFDEIVILPRVLRGLGPISTTLELFNSELSAPILIAPTAYQGLLSLNGELDMLSAVNQFKTIMIASMFSSVDYALISKNRKYPVWLQMYFLNDQNFNSNFIKTINELNFDALVLTVDAPVYATKNRDKAIPLSFPTDMTFSHLAHLGVDVDKYLTSKGHFSSLLSRDISWDHLDWLANKTHLPIILKGIIDPRDTEIAMKYPNVKGIIVSNHGGRQLESCPSAISLVKEHKNIAGNKLKVLLDGGISKGSDIFKALALGADATLIGRAALWALSTGGTKAVLETLSTLQKELLETMTLCGVSSIKEIGSGLIEVRRKNET